MNTLSLSWIKTVDNLQKSGMEFSITLRNTDPVWQSMPDTFKVFTDEIKNLFRLSKAGGIKANHRQTLNCFLFIFIKTQHSYNYKSVA
jgi:hypothetical protein